MRNTLQNVSQITKDVLAAGGSHPGGKWASHIVTTEGSKWGRPPHGQKYLRPCNSKKVMPYQYLNFFTSECIKIQSIRGGSVPKKAGGKPLATAVCDFNNLSFKNPWTKFCTQQIHTVLGKLPNVTTSRIWPSLHTMPVKTREYILTIICYSSVYHSTSLLSIIRAAIDHISYLASCSSCRSSKKARDLQRER